MKLRWLFAVALGAATASAQPNLSQHPRMGELGRLVFVENSNRMASAPPAAARNDDLLGEALGWARTNPDGTVELHCASSELGLQRARVVRDRLVASGLDGDRIAIIGDQVSDARGVIVVGTER